jgi:hypothetical protein
MCGFSFLSIVKTKFGVKWKIYGNIVTKLIVKNCVSTEDCASNQDVNSTNSALVRTFHCK